MVKTFNKQIIILLLFFSYPSYAQQDPVFFPTSETLESIILNLEAISILDSVSEKVWPGWRGHEGLAFFIGASDNNAVFINPAGEIPNDFRNLNLGDTQNMIYVREQSNLSSMYSGTIIELDRRFYEVICMPPIGNDSNHYYLKRINDYLGNDSIHSLVDQIVNSPEYYISVITHEAFHFYQRNKQYPANYKTVNPRYYKKSKVLVYSYIEGDLLKKALHSNNDIEQKQFVYQFLAVRDDKNRFLTKNQIMYEMVDEFMEGTAQYVQTQIQMQLEASGYVSLQDHSSNNPPTFTNSSDFLLLDSLCMEVSINDPKDPGIKHYFYGQTQARILDKLCGDLWKNEIMNKHVYLTDLLSKYSGYDSKNQGKYVQQVMRDYDYNDILKAINNARK